MALPDAVEYGTVSWRAVSAAADGVDVDGLPDAVPVTGTVTFTPSARVMLAINEAPPVTVFATPVTYTLDSAGVLRDTTGRDEITLVATDSAGLTPVGWTWTCSYRLNDSLVRGSFSFALPAGEHVDLTTVAPVASSGGVSIIQGPAGPVGGSLPIVIHGSNAATARPDTELAVIWIGSVEPNNADDTLDVYVPVTAG